MSTSTSQLRYGKDFSASSKPLRAPVASSPHVLVIGGGVSGFTTSWLLLDRGYRVTIISESWATYTKAQRLTSQISGALWEFPSAPCGPQVSPDNLSKLRRWALEGYQTYSALADDAEVCDQFGVRLRKNVSFFPVPMESNDIERERLHEIKKAKLRNFTHDAGLIKKYDNSGFGVADAFEHLSPVIDTDRAMQFMSDLLKAKGAVFVPGAIHGDLWENETRLLKIWEASAIVNCTGLGARDLASDPNVIPARGGVLRVVNDGTDFPRITNAMVVNTEDPEDYNVVFIVPRNDRILILGTFIERDKWTTDLTLDSPVMRTMREQCERFVPALKNARLDPEYPIAQGLRPLRKGDVRVEIEPRKRDSRESHIVHAYGHGIGGWTLAWGAAREAAQLVDKVVSSQKGLSKL